MTMDEMKKHAMFPKFKAWANANPELFASSICVGVRDGSSYQQEVDRVVLLLFMAFRAGAVAGMYSFLAGARAALMDLDAEEAAKHGIH